MRCGSVEPSFELAKATPPKLIKAPQPRVITLATRDERLKEGNTEINRLANELNASIRKFNELATNYNAAVKDLNDLRARMSQSLPANPAQPARKPESQRPQ